MSIANRFDFLLLSDEFCVLELTAKCDIFSCSLVAVSNIHHYNRQIEATSNRIVRQEERVLAWMRELERDCDRVGKPESVTLSSLLATRYSYRNRELSGMFRS
jgi:hypothetical protein